MANLIGFIDETGVLQKDPNQRFFGLGFLKLEKTVPLYDELVRLKNRILAVLTNLQKPFEFKFNDINRTNFQYYQELLDIYFGSPYAAFCSLVIDKQRPQFNIEKNFGNVWDAYIGYSRLVIEKNVDEKDKICILADYLSKPKLSQKYYEVEIGRGNGESCPVFNACMLESHASLFIQLVDVLIGCVVFDFRMKSQMDHPHNQFKQDLVKLLCRKLSVESLVGKITQNHPNYFSVWPFEA